MFQIVEIQPVYHHSTDGLIGSRVVWRSHAYETRALAHKIAGRRALAENENCGDGSFAVVAFGASPFHFAGRWDFSEPAAKDDLPF